MKVLRQLPRRRKPPKAPEASVRRARIARNIAANSKPRAETATVADDCCSIPGISWMDQPSPCRHDCHFSEYSWRKAEAVEAVGPIEPAPVRKDQALIQTACGHCGHVSPDPTEAAQHVASHKPERLQPTEGHDWPDAYADGQSWGRYVSGPRARKQKEAA